MNVIDAIANRRSIRKFLDKDIDKIILEQILKAGINAPSPKNSQPWKFIVVTRERKFEMLNIIKTGIDNIKSTFEVLIDAKDFLVSAESTIKIMEEAPVVIFVINTANKFMPRQTPVRKYIEIANIQSVGASIQNMLLASLEYGIGGLWISDIFFTVQEISEWLNTDMQIAAAVALGYPAENPPSRTRKGLDALVEWR